MNFCSYIVRDQSDDSFAIRCRKALSGVCKAARQSVDPQPAVGIEHHLDDCRIFQNPAMAGPNAVRSIRAPRRFASESKEWIATICPKLLRPLSRPHLKANKR